MLLDTNFRGAVLSGVLGFLPVRTILHDRG
jgi:hypothetical protein